MQSPFCFHDKITDVCVIGSGPHALSVVSRLKEIVPRHLSDRDLTTLRKYYDVSAEESRSNDLSITVVDPSGKWMSRWDDAFEQQSIQWLRSPVTAHPDPSDDMGLLSYALAHNRENELLQLDNIFFRTSNETQHATSRKTQHLRGGERGRKAKQTNSFNQENEKQYRRPSTKLFRDFVQHQIKRYKLSDIVVKAAAERIEPIFAEDSNESDPTRPVEYFKIHLSCRDAIYARKVVVASGLTQANNPDWTKAIEPSSYPANTLTHSDYVRLSGPNKIEVKSKRVLIVGSGLSSGHLVLCAQKLGCAKVVLASRKLLQSKQFDIGLEWVGRYKSNHLNAFWDLDMQGRFNMIKDARGGGTLAPDVLAAVRASAKSHPNQVQVREEVQVTSSKWIPDPVTLAKGMGHWEVSFTDGRTEQFDFIWLATGRRRDVASEPIFKDIIEHCPIPLVNGLPCVDIDLRWREGVELYVTGAYAALQIGPEAINLAGAKHSSERIFTGIDGGLIGDDNLFSYLEETQEDPAWR